MTVVCNYEGFFDESRNDQSTRLFVGGFLFLKNELSKFSDQWTEALGDLTCFHMREGMRQSHPDVYEKLYAILASAGNQAFVATLLESDFEAVMEEVKRSRAKNIRAKQNPKYLFGGAYTFCVQYCLRRVGHSRMRTARVLLMG